MKIKSVRFVFVGLVVLLAVIVYAYLKSGRASFQGVEFRHSIIDKNGPRDPWGKAIGDVNGDGLIDLIVGGNDSQELVWYQAPDWQKHLVAKGHRFSTDHAVVDLDGDGRNDIISLSKEGVFWFKGPNWEESLITTTLLHDIEAADLDLDGDLDLIGRNQSAFGNGETIYVFEQVSPSDWKTFTLTVPAGEGLKIADLDLDGDSDIIVNGMWFENQFSLQTGQSLSEKSWVRHIFSDSWDWPHTFIDVADINQDGFPDILLSPAELAGQFYRLSWFASPGGKQGKRHLTQKWEEHTIAANVEAVLHFVGAADFDNDGDIDVMTAQMHQGEDPDAITLYLNLGQGERWRAQQIATTGSHSMKLFDLGNDGDMDVFGANWSGPRQSVELWENQTCNRRGPDWVRHVIDANRPGGAIFISAADINGDQFPDIVTGGWWYENPATQGNGSWRRHQIGGNLNNMALVFDIDQDGDPDILGTRGRGAEANGQLLWARNDQGRFTAYFDVANSSGDFLQGVALMNHANQRSVALSWHQAGHGIEQLSLGDPERPWPLSKLSPVSQDEALSSADIDGDGDQDLVLGTLWLENKGREWQPHVIHETTLNPDRNRLADINGDGRLDVIVGYEAISRPGKLAWYEAPAGDPRQPWREHAVAEVTGPMSLDVADINHDGLPDIIVGEHNLKTPEQARLLIFYNHDGTWRESLVYQGDEHHDGAQTVDLDGDGDLDIISIGWGHNRVVWYENRLKFCGSSRQAVH